MVTDDPQMNFGFEANSRIPADAVGLVSTSPAGTLFRGWMHNPGLSSNDNARLSFNELASLNALISYVAQNSQISAYRIEQKLADHFLVANVRLLASDQFDPALCFLVNMLDT